MRPEVPIAAMMDAVLADEGWQGPLEPETVAAVIARLEAHYPPEAVLTAEAAERLRAGLRTLGAWAGARRAGTLSEGSLAEGMLAVLGL